MSYKQFFRTITSVVVAVGLGACGATDDLGKSDDEDIEEPILETPDDIPLDEITIDNIPEHQLLDFQEYVQDTWEHRTPIGNVYEVVDTTEEGEDVFYVYFNEEEAIVEAYAYEGDSFTDGDACYRAPVGDEPNAVLNQVELDVDSGFSPEQYFEQPEIFFTVDGYNSRANPTIDLVGGTEPDTYGLRWLRDEYGLLTGFELLRGEDVIAMTAGQIDREVTVDGYTARISLNLEPVDVDPEELKLNRCGPTLFGLFKNPTPELDNAEEYQFGPYEDAPDYTVFVDERVYKGVYGDPLFPIEDAPRDDHIFGLTFHYENHSACYRLSDQQYLFNYNAVRDNYYFVSWLRMEDPEVPPMFSVTLDPKSEGEDGPVLSLDTYTYIEEGSYELDAHSEGDSVYVPYDGSSRDDWKYGGIGLSFVPATSLSMEEFAEQTCEPILEL